MNSLSISLASSELSAHNSLFCNWWLNRSSIVLCFVRLQQAAKQHYFHWWLEFLVQESILSQVQAKSKIIFSMIKSQMTAQSSSITLFSSHFSFAAIANTTSCTFFKELPQVGAWRSHCENESILEQERARETTNQSLVATADRVRTRH